MINILIYDADDGRIISSVSGPDNMVVDHLVGDGFSFIEHMAVDIRTHYISSGSVTTRETSSAYFDESSMTILDVPPKTSIIINGESSICNDGVVELSFEYVGTYVVKLECWPFLDKEFNIEVTS